MWEKTTNFNYGLFHANERTVILKAIITNRERELQDQLQRASALNILINAISIWNTTYLQKAINYMKSIGGFNEDLLKHIAPLGWEHINFLGEYTFEMRNVPESDELRPLNIGS